MSTKIQGFRAALTKLQGAAEKAGRNISKSQVASALRSLEGGLTPTERKQVESVLRKANLSPAATALITDFFDAVKQVRRNDGDVFGGGRVHKIRADDPTGEAKPPKIVKVMADVPQKVRADEPSGSTKPPQIVKVMADVPQKVRADEPSGLWSPQMVKVAADVPQKVRADEPSGPTKGPVVNKVRADVPEKVRADEPSGPTKGPVVNKVRADEPA